MDKIFKIYKIQFPNGKVYIGQTCNYYKRCREHLREAIIGNQLKVYRAIRKYSITINNFSIIEDNIFTQEEANQKEINYIKQFNSMDDGYNSAPGGNSGWQKSGEEHPNAILPDSEILTIRQIRHSCKYTLKEIYEFYKNEMSYSGFEKIWNYEIRQEVGKDLDSEELHIFYKSFTKTLGEAHGNSKITDKEVIDLRNKYYVDGISMNELYINYKDVYTLSGFRKIISGASFAHLPMPIQSSKCTKKQKLSKEDVLLIRQKYQEGLKIKEIINNWFPSYSESSIYLIATKQRYKNY